MNRTSEHLVDHDLGRYKKLPDTEVESFGEGSEIFEIRPGIGHRAGRLDPSDTRPVPAGRISPITDATALRAVRQRQRNFGEGANGESKFSKRVALASGKAVQR